MFSSHAKRILSLAGEVVNLAKRNTNGMAYLVCQGQQVVVEEDGCDRHRIILVVIPHWKLQNRRKMDAHLYRGSGDLGLNVRKGHL